MMGGSESGSGDKDGVHATAIHVPIGWQRKVDDGQVVYVSPSGTVLASVDQVKTYLMTDGTCKCGLECPLVVHKVFNFSLAVKAEQQAQVLARAEQDMTKLCNHRRKVVAMAWFSAQHHTEVTSGGSETRDPKRARVDRDEEDHGTSHPKPHSVLVLPNSSVTPGPCPSPKSSPQLAFPYNGTPLLLHTSTNSHHPLDALRRLQHPPPLPPSSSSSSSSSSAPQRSPRTPTPQNLSQGQRLTPKTPDNPSSPRLGPLSSPPPPSSPVGGVGGRGTQTHPPHSVIVAGSPLSPVPSPSSSLVGNINCLSPHQRTLHPCTSLSTLSEQGGGGVGVSVGSNFPQRRKSASSSPLSSPSPLPGGSPNPGLHLPKYKLEDILEQFKNSGNGSTNNNHLLFPASSSSSLLTNQSSNPHILSLALDKSGSLKSPKGSSAQGPHTGSSGFGLNPPGPSGLPIGPFLSRHHSHQARPPHPGSFPASSLLSAAAKAQLASQMTPNQSPGLGSSSLGSASPLEVLKEAQQPQKVTNSTLHNNHPPSSVASARPPPHPSLAASSLLFPSSHPLAQTLASSQQLPTVGERGASHRKRQRRSPTVLSMLRETQQLANGARNTTPVDLASSAIINLSSSSSTSTSQSHNAAVLESHHHLLLPGQKPRLSARSQAPLVGPHRQIEALDFTTGLGSAASGSPLGLDPPTQPLSALLHLLSLQNAQASAQLGSGVAGGGEGGGGVNRPSPRLSPPSPGSTSSIIRPLQTRSPCRTNNTTPQNSTPQPLSPPPSSSSSSQSRSTQSPSQSRPVKISPRHRPPPPSCTTLQSVSLPHQAATSQQHIPSAVSVSHAPVRESPPQVPMTTERDSSHTSTTSDDMSHSQGSVAMTTAASPKPLDLSNHVLALLAASSTAPQGEGGSSSDRTVGTNTNKVPEETVGVIHQGSAETKPSGDSILTPGPTQPSPPGSNTSPNTPSILGDTAASLPLAEAFPFMNQEQLLQLLSSMGGLPSILDPTILASLPLGGLWVGGQQGQMPPAPGTPQPPPNLSEQQQLLQLQQQHSDQQQKQISNPLFPLLPSLVGAQGELPLNLLGLLNPMLPPTASAATPGQEADLGLAEKQGLQALLMASLLVGQQQAAVLPLAGLGQLSLEMPLQQPQQVPTALDALSLDKSSGLLDPSSLPSPGLLEVLQGLIPPLPTPAEGSLQALQSLLLHTSLPPPPPAAFLPLSPALLTAALGSAELHPPPHTQLGPAQQTQHTSPQVTSDPGMDTLIPLPLQGKDNPLLQQLLPALLNPTVVGDLSGLTGLHSLLGLGAGPLLLPPVQASTLGMPLLQGPDGAINLLNNIQLNIAPPTEGDKPITLQEPENPTPQEDIPANQLTPEVTPSPCPTPVPAPAPTLPPHRRSESSSVGSGGVIDPYTSFMDTIYTSFLQVSAKEQEEGAQSGPADPTSPFCALPPVPFPGDHTTPATPLPALPQASAPVSLSPRRACSLRNPDLSRLSLEGAAHSPAQGTPKPSDEGSASPLRRKAMLGEAQTHPEPPLPPIFLEEAKTDCAGPGAAVCPYGEAGVERQGVLAQPGGYHSPRDASGGRPKEEAQGGLLHLDQSRDQTAPTGGRRGRKRKQTLQNVLEDFRDMDSTALEEHKPTAVLLKPERSVRGRRRRGARSQRQ